MTKYISNADKNFIFTPAGNPLNKLKVEAKQRFNRGEFASLSESQNSLARKMFNQPFNKLSKSCELASPFIKNQTLFLPIKVNDNESDISITTFVTINKDCVRFESGNTLYHHHYTDSTVTIEDLKIGDIEVINNGWIIKPFPTAPNCHYEVKFGDEGVVVDLIEDNGSGVEVLDSAWALYSELFDIYDFNDKFLSGDKTLCANSLALALEHENEDDQTELFYIMGYTAVLIGYFSISENGTNNSDLPYTRDESEMFLTAHGAKEWACSAGGEITFPNHIVLHGAVIDLVDGEGGIVKTLDFLPNNLSQLALELADNWDR